MDIDEQIEELILEGEDTKKVALKRGEYGIYYLDGEQYEKWISKCTLVMDKHYKGSSLYEKFIEASQRAVGNGEKYYNTMIGVLKAIREQNKHGMVGTCEIKQRKIFISHSSKNKSITDEFVELLKTIGIKNEQIYYSSYEETGADFLQDCLERICKEFKQNDLLVIFMISREFYRSKICLAEMGATWVATDNRYIPIIIPPYNYDNVEGVINATQTGISLFDKSISTKMEKLKSDIEEFLQITEKVDSSEWIRKKELFLKKIQSLQEGIQEVEGKLIDIKIENQNGKAQVMFKVALINNTVNRMKLERVVIHLMRKEQGDWEIPLEGWNIDAIVIKPLEEIAVYLPANVDSEIKRSSVQLEASSISLEFYSES